jgi:hypothetical protein
MPLRVLFAGLCLTVAGIAGLTAGAHIALAALILGAVLSGGVVPWLLLRPYLRDEAARRARGGGCRENRGSLGFVPDMIERDSRAREAAERRRG